MLTTIIALSTLLLAVSAVSIYMSVSQRRTVSGLEARLRLEDERIALLALIAHYPDPIAAPFIVEKAKTLLPPDLKVVTTQTSLEIYRGYKDEEIPAVPKRGSEVLH
jgi:hypothetical protein